MTEAGAPEPQTLSIPSSERRLLTVMVCQLVGSAALSSGLDPEDLREIVAAYRRVVAKIVNRFDGFAIKSIGEYVGESVLACFGYPTGQENDAERAVRAALAIQRALSDHNSEKVSKGAPELSARIGLDCGLVVVEFDWRGVWRRAERRRSPVGRRRTGNVLVTTNVLRQVSGLFVTEEGARGPRRGSTMSTYSASCARAAAGGGQPRGR